MNLPDYSLMVHRTSEYGLEGEWLEPRERIRNVIREVCRGDYSQEEAVELLTDLAWEQSEYAN